MQTRVFNFFITSVGNSGIPFSQLYLKSRTYQSEERPETTWNHLKPPETSWNYLTAKNTIISFDFLVWKICGKAQFPHSFRWIARNYAEVVPFGKISTPGSRVKLPYFSQCLKPSRKYMKPPETKWNYLKPVILKYFYLK